jgi:hypothetical protein
MTNIAATAITPSAVVRSARRCMRVLGIEFSSLALLSAFS